MKNLIITMALLASVICSRAQSDSFYVDLGVNAIRLLQVGLGNGQADPDIWNPYMLTGDVHYKRLGLRLGIGADSYTRTEQPTLANGMTTVQTDSSRSDFRIGLNVETALSQKWTFKFGVDYFSASSAALLETEFTNESDEKVITTHKAEMNMTGFSPFAAIQYHVTPRMSVGTELLWRFANYTMNDSDSSNLVEADIERNYSGTHRWIMAPTALYLIARF